MKLRLLSAAALVLSLAALPAFAADLHTARTQGLVGEKLDGYVAAIQNTPEIQALVNDVNAKRRDEYNRISKANGQTPDVVGKLAAEEIYKKLQPGSPYQGPGGGWQKR